MSEETAITPPAGEYAIVECLGHRTLVGRTSEVERFGTKMLSIEPIFRNELMPAVLVGGSSLYAFTPCSGEVAFARQPRNEWELPASIRATLPALALPAPGEEAPEFNPQFLREAPHVDGCDCDDCTMF
jgi:hypothetical protein